MASIVLLPAVADVIKKYHEILKEKGGLFRVCGHRPILGNESGASRNFLLELSRQEMSVKGFEDAKHKEDIYFEIIEPETLHYTFKVRPAQDFGVPFNDSLHNVGLVVAEPAHGCSAPINKLELRNNIALIERGGCSFLSKCIQAERSGVLAVMICDNDISNDDQYIDMIDDSTKRNCSIPAVFLLGKDGYMIKKSLKTHNLTRAIINIPINMTFVPNHEHRQPPWVLW